MDDQSNNKLYLQRFYHTKRWARCRDAFLKSKGMLCERCLAKGLYVPATVVHHRVRLDPQTVNNPAIALNWDNLEALCRTCHEKEHDRGRKRRYDFDEYGNLIVPDT